MDRLNSPRSLYLWMALFTTAFVVYGSLVPFQLRGHSLADAITLFSDIRYLQLGASSRADLIANLLIYIPVGFFWSAVISKGGSRQTPLAKWFVLAALLMGLAWLVEFLQLFVAPRTVSRNDLISESLGIVAGIGLWRWMGHRCDRTLRVLLERQRVKVSTLWWGFFTAWLVYSLMPFDFFIRLSELKWALDVKGYPFVGLGLEEWQSFSIHEALVLMLEAGVAWLGGAVFAATPWGVRLGRRGKGAWVFLAALIFAAVELLQYFEYSGSSSLTSVLVKTLAFAVGVRSSFLTNKHAIERWMIRWSRLFKLGWPLFLVFVLFIKHWTLSPSQDLQGRVDTLLQLSWVPFYYHYFTTEMAALKSVMLQIAIISPVALFAWCRYKLSKTKEAYSLSSHAIWVAAGAFMLETGGLLWNNIRPDYTNVLIMAAVYPLTFIAYDVLFNSLFPDSVTPTLPNRPKPLVPSTESPTNQRVYIPRPEEVSTKAQSYAEEVLPEAVLEQWEQHVPQEPLWQPISYIFSACAALLIALAAMYYVVDYPSHPVLLAVVALLVGFALYRSPILLLVLLPACVPWADGYVFTGRFILTELDLLIMLGIVVHYAKQLTVKPTLFLPKRAFLLMAGLTGLYVVSVLWALYRIDGGANPQSFFSTDNLFRVAKPWLWLLLLLPVLGYHFLNQPKRATQSVAMGMCLGLLALLVSVVLERWLFTGLWASGEDALHRVRGSFVTMHTGGGHIDAYLVAATPFLLLPWLMKLSVFWRVLATLGALVSFYAIFVTYSRGPYAVAAVSVVLCYLFWRVAQRETQAKRTWVAVLTGGIALIWLASPFMIPSFLTERLSIVDRDTHTRIHQWERVTDLMGPSALSYLVGMGPGMLPRAIMIGNAQSSVPSTYHRWVEDADGAYLSIQSGRSYYTNQYVHPEQGETYHYRVEYRAPVSDVRLNLSLCEKWIDDSHRCQTEPVTLPKADTWQNVEGEFTVTAFNESEHRSLARALRPVTLAFFTHHNQPALELSALSIRDQNNESLIQNGDFSNQLDHWYITSDNHLDWHAKNIWVNVYFDLGFLGVLFYGALLLLILAAGFKAIKEGDRWSIPFVVGLIAYFGVGMVASLFDVPQLTLMMLLLSSVIGLRRVALSVASEINHVR
jgi:VanZ family protein